MNHRTKELAKKFFNMFEERSKHMNQGDTNYNYVAGYYTSMLEMLATSCQVVRDEMQFHMRVLENASTHTGNNA